MQLLNPLGLIVQLYSYQYSYKYPSLLRFKRSNSSNLSSNKFSERFFSTNVSQFRTILIIKYYINYVTEVSLVSTKFRLYSFKMKVGLKIYFENKVGYVVTTDSCIIAMYFFHTWQEPFLKRITDCSSDKSTIKKQTLVCILNYS